MSQQNSPPPWTKEQAKRLLLTEEGRHLRQLLLGLRESNLSDIVSAATPAGSFEVKGKQIKIIPSEQRERAVYARGNLDQLNFILAAYFDPEGNA